MYKLIRLILLVIVLVFNPNLISKIAKAQVITWERILEYDDYNIFNRIQNTFDSGFVAVGTVRYNSTNKAFICRFNKYGDTLWTRILFKQNLYDYPTYWIEQTYDNGFVITGGDGSFQGGDAYVSKLDSLGKIEWIHNYGGSDLEQGRCVKITPDKGLIVLARANSYSNTEDLMVIKLDSLGEFQWQKILNSGSEDYAGEIVVTRNGYAVSASYGTSLLRIRIYFLDADGNTLSIKEYSNNKLGLIANSLQLTSDEGYLLGGYASDGNISDQSYVLKTDSAGKVEWEKYYNSHGYEECHSAREMRSHEYAICGRADTAFHGDNKKAFVRIIDSSGNILNEEFFSPGDNSNRFNSIEITHDDGLILGGFAGMTIFGPYGYAVKTDSLGNVVVNINNYSTIVEDKFFFELLQNFPNPFNSETKIVYKVHQSGEFNFSLFDVLGKKVMESKIGYQRPGTYQIRLYSNLLNLPSGIYYYSLTIIKSNISEYSLSRKFVLIK